MHPHRNAIAFGSLVFLVVTFILLIIAALWAWPKYKVYKQEMDGIAALREAEWSKQILIEEAKAREQAALMQAKAKVTLAQAEGQAEIERAKATAEANRIIGDSLKNNDAYLRYLWIMGLQDESGERIYIPTEAGLPILGAGKAGK
ncbi:hypothetical protein [Bowmanella sp. JS7-9]|uniref:Membrane protease subunit n=1 Tax=Pseudobowmanella zhangzhouensis TaxID=1537679 RepID=A0ABW1XFD6_9ALTE|nr:hypothetical protein [Bowmanella sp. JS7-9]TBX20794.1 hypothetical protein TK45_13480 [Bowmanella sp. JS7-9]